jgi:5'-nucleotidase
VSFDDAFTMQPFGNSLVVMTLSGAELKSLLESQQRPGRGAPTLLAPSAGLAYRWVAGAPFGQRVQDLRLNGAPLDAARDYRITVNSFLADGGDGFTALGAGHQRSGGGQDIDALLAYLQTVPAPVAVPRVEWVD